MSGYEENFDTALINNWCCHAWVLVKAQFNGTAGVPVPIRVLYMNYGGFGGVLPLFFSGSGAGSGAQRRDRCDLATPSRAGLARRPPAGRTASCGVGAQHRQLCVAGVTALVWVGWVVCPLCTRAWVHAGWAPRAGAPPVARLRPRTAQRFGRRDSFSRRHCHPPAIA